MIELRAPQRSTVRFSTLQIGWMTFPGAPAPTSGAERYYFSLLRALPETGVGARGVVLGAIPQIDLGGASLDLLAPTGTTRRERVARTRARVAELLDECELAVSHCAPHAHPVLDLIRRRGREIVVHFHGPWSAERLLQGLGPSVRFPLTALQEIAVYRRSARVIVLFEAYARLLERVYRIAPEKVRVVPGGVDLERFTTEPSRADARAWFGLPRDRPVILTVARIVHGKGIGRLIDALALVRRRIPDPILVVAGDGPLAPHLRERARARGLGDAVRFIGHRIDDLPLAYRAADVSVTTAFGHDGFGLVVPESLACGTPVLLIPLSPGEHPLRSPIRFLPGWRPSAIAAGLIDAFEGAFALAGEEVCRHAALAYDWRTIAPRLRAIYEEVL